MRLLTLLILTMTFYTGYSQINFYKIKMKDLKGDSINLENLRGSMILIVNTATDSSEKQLAELQALETKFADSGLVILAIPSNDFGNENKNSEELKSTYNKYKFKVAEPQNVRGPNQSDLYKWLSKATLNGIVDNPINGDFKKFLVNRAGRLVGAFHESSSVTDHFFLMSFNVNK